MENSPPVSYQFLGDYFRSQSPDILVREVWHTHNREHYGKQIGTEWLPQRAAEYLRILDVIQPRRKQSDSYAPKWLPIPNDPEMIDSYARLFYEFNCFLSLNYYSHAYGMKKAELFQAQNRLRQMRSMPRTFSPDKIKQQDERILELGRQLPRDCFMDLAFDFDVGETCELKTLSEAIPKVLILLNWLEDAAAPYELYFSGSRGFHVVVPYQVFRQTRQAKNHRVHEHLVSMIELQTERLFVDRSIFSVRKQLRLVNTRHSKSLLFKIQLAREDIIQGEQHVLAMARSKQPFSAVDCVPSGRLQAMYADASEVIFNESKSPVRPRDVKMLKRTLGHDLNKPGTEESLLQLDRLSHPACITQAITHGVMDTSRANRNQVTLLLANYFKLIGRDIHETNQFLSKHATTILAQFSGSTPAVIKASTRGAVQTVFHDDKYFFTCSRARGLGFSCDPECIYNEFYSGTPLERSLTTVPYQPPPAAPQEHLYESIDELRPVIYEKIEEYLADCEARPAKQYPPFIVIAPPGSGKTTQAYHFIAKSGKRSLMVSPQYRLYNNIPEEYTQDWIRIMGRHGGVQVKGEAKRIGPNCSKPTIVKKFGDRNYNVFQKVCERCEEFINQQCVYFNQFKDRNHNWFIQQPTFVHKAKNIIPQFDYIFMDESSLSSYIDTQVITRSMVQDVQIFLKKLMEFWDHWANDEESRQAEFLLAFLNVFLALMNDKLLPSSLSGGLLYQHMNLRYQSMFSSDNGYPETFESLIAEIDSGWRDALNTKTDLDLDIPEDALPYNFLPGLFNVLDEEIHHAQSPDVISSLVLKKDPVNPKALLSMKYDPPPLSRPTVVLDATAKAEVYRRIFNHSVRIFAPKLSYNNPIVQLYSVYGGVTSLASSKQQMKNMLEGLKELLKKEPATLIVCKERFEKRIRKMGLPKEAQITHFYGSRGSNDYQSAKQVVIFGAPGWNKETLFAYAAALYPGEELSSKQWFPLRQYHGTNKAIRMREYVDPRVQMLYEMSVIDEIIQALNRIRPLIFGDKMIYLMTNVVIPGLPISQFMSLNELRNTSRGKTQISQLVEEFIDKKIRQDGFATMKEIGSAVPQVSQPGIIKIAGVYQSENANVELGLFRITRKGNVTTNQILVDTTLSNKTLLSALKEKISPKALKIEKI